MLKVVTVLLVLALSAAAEKVDLNKGTNFDALVKPGKYIIEVEHASDLPAVKQGDAHAAVYDALAKRGIGFRVNREFKQEGLFLGASVELQVRHGTFTGGRSSADATLSSVSRTMAQWKRRQASLESIPSVSSRLPSMLEGFMKRLERR